MTKPLFTPDGRYLIVRKRLWRTSNPQLSKDVRASLVHALMSARRDVRSALQDKDVLRLKRARAAVDAAKHGLGERGAVWWTDGSPDYNRHLVKNSPYADWYAASQTA